ncbi:MAG: DUF5121 domain-containing protein [Bacteroidaceae bacterium]|nr:DUF5121 domain-containing protein [Bacteroidaceae bacterium]
MKMHLPMKLSTLILLCLALMMPQTLCAQSTEKKIVAYVTSWSSVTPDPFVMTHINYAFGGVGSDGVSVYADGTSRMQQLVRLKSRNPKLKVLLSIGGWGRGNFSPMAKDETKRKAFAQACRAFCDRYNLDGIDIDWEFPGNNSSGETSPSNEKQNYTLLMRDLREALGGDLLLTMASSADPGYYDFKNCIQYLDFVNVMTYDMSGPPNHHSALYRGGKVGNGWLVQSESIQNHLKAGIPASKLVMGLAFYGNSGSGSQISLQEIKNGIASGRWTDNWDDVAKVPYVTDSSGKFAYGYDDERSLTVKCQYLVKQKLAGAMYWEYANDDNKGTERKTVYECLLGGTYDGLTFGDVPLNYMGANAYSAVLDMEQGRVYYASGAEPMNADTWFYDQDFFSRQSDGGYLFLAVSGKYSLTADFLSNCFRIIPLDEEGQPLIYNPAEGTGCVWVIGANSSIGKPKYIEGDDASWDEANAFPMAPIGKNRYRLTLEVGKQLNPNMVNFKLFHQNSFTGGEFTMTSRYRITINSRIFTISNTTTEKGNIKLKSTAKITEGQIYVFTLDPSGITKSILTVEDYETGLIQSFEIPSLPNSFYNLQGIRVPNPQSGNIYLVPSESGGWRKVAK